MEISSRRKSIMKITVVIGALIIPLLYSFFYLGAFWDPYSQLKSVPVAIVNEDAGATISGDARNIGDELCNKLKEDGTLKFVFTNEEKAKKGVNGDKYYAMLTIPKDFSKNVASASSTDKKTAILEYAVNEKRNYIASQILNSAVAKIEKEVRSSIDGEITLTLANKLKEVPRSLQTLSNGFDDMYDGSQKLVTGSTTLDKGASDLNSGANKLNFGGKVIDNGVSSLKTGTSKLSKGSSDLDGGISDLLDGVKKINGQVPALKSGVSDLNVGMNGDGTTPGLKASVSNYTSSVETASNGLNSYTVGLKSYTTALTNLYNSTTDPTTKATLDAILNGASGKQGLINIVNGTGTSNPGIAGINSGLKDIVSNNTAINNGAGAIATGISTLNGKVPALQKGLNQLQSGVETAKAGSLQVASGASTLNSGASTLKSGTTNLVNGTDTLAKGTETLKSGTDSLVSGMNTLNSGIKAGKDGVNTSIKDTNEQLKAVDGINTYAENPVKVNKDAVDYVPNYGTAFAPYFLSLSLWVGGLIIFFGIYLDVDKRYKYLCRDSANVVIRSFAYLILGVAQALILAFVIKSVLGLEIEHMTQYVLSCVLVSVVFISIIQFCLVHLKDFGKFLALLLLILQLTSCGGTFPMETVPKFFEILYPYMPMTYSVGLFKEAISGATGSNMIKNVTVLIVIMIVAMIATILMSVMKKGARALRKAKKAATAVQ